MSQLTPTQQTQLDAKRARLFALEHQLELIEAGKIAAGGLLLEIREGQLWSVDPDRAYADFYAYTELRWGFAKREADRKIEAWGQVQELLGAGVPQADLPTNPWQTRDLTVLINKTDVATGARTWVAALTDSRDPTKNPAGRLTGAFLKGYVDAALQQQGAGRRRGSSRARAGTSTAATNGRVVHVTGHTRRVGGIAPVATNATATPAGTVVAPSPAVGAQSTNGLGVLPPEAVSVELLFELADDVRTRRVHVGNPLARKPLFDGLRALIVEVRASLTAADVQGQEARDLSTAAAALSDVVERLRAQPATVAP